jgi:multidrug efflux pump subunit AcrB
MDPHPGEGHRPKVTLRGQNTIWSAGQRVTTAAVFLRPATRSTSDAIVAHEPAREELPQVSGSFPSTPPPSSAHRLKRCDDLFEAMLLVTLVVLTLMLKRRTTLIPVLVPVAIIGTFRTSVPATINLLTLFCPGSRSAS